MENGIRASKLRRKSTNFDFDICYVDEMTGELDESKRRREIVQWLDTFLFNPLDMKCSHEAHLLVARAALSLDDQKDNPISVYANYGRNQTWRPFVSKSSYSNNQI
jgi:hypothetical protein